MTFFSVVIATRNRPDLFRQALRSVLAQRGANSEVIVVNDSSSTDHQLRYQAVFNEIDSARVHSFLLPIQPRGHGGAYPRNFGAAKATAPYLCFLDDDDSWSDPEHLARAQTIIENCSVPIDLYLTNQEAFLCNLRQSGPIWIEDLPPILARTGNQPDHHGAYTVTAETLLKSQGFSHLNTVIVRTELFRQLGGFDEKNGWEEDRDLYLRLIDRAKSIKYCPAFVARHNIPNAQQGQSITISQSDFEKRLSQLRLLDRAIFSSRHAAIRAYARRHKAYTLQRITSMLVAEGRHPEAAFYAREALGARPTAKWAAFTAWCLLQAFLGPLLATYRRPKKDTMPTVRP